MSVVCRTCLHQIYDDNFLSINDSTVVKNQLSQCIPEMTLSLVTNSIMCTACSAALDFAYNFKSRCLQAEKHILNHMNETASSSNIDGTRLIEILFKPLTNGIKRELIVPDEPQVDYFMSTEEVAVDDDENATDDCTNDEHSLEGGIEIMKQDLEDPDYKPCDAFPVVDNPFSSLTSIEEEADVSSGETLENMDYPNFEEYNLNDSSIVNRKPWKNGLKATYRAEEKESIACTFLLPEKSKKRYELSYKAFKDWCLTKSNAAVSESLLLTYFLEKSTILKSPLSLWSEYSMLKTTICINENTDISKYPKLRAFLKRKNDGYRPKKSNGFSREEMNQFLGEAPDNTYLLIKVVMIMGIAGACRSNELCQMKLENVKEKGCVIIVNIPNSRNGMPRVFTITTHEENNDGYLQIVKKYINIRSKITTENPRFFMRYQAGKCFNQPVGKNTIAEMPCKIAQFLNLENPKSYTGHSFRRTSATLLATAGVDVLALNRHGGWKSSRTAESYVANSLMNKNKVANQILYNRCNTEVAGTSSD